MDEHDLILRDIRWLVEQDTVWPLDVTDPEHAALRIEAEQARAAADAAASDVLQYERASQRADEVIDLKRREAASRAGNLTARVADPRRTGTARNVARSWILSTAW